MEPEWQVTAAADLKFAVHPGQVLLNRANRDKELVGDLAVAEAIRGEGSNPHFGLAQDPVWFQGDINVTFILLVSGFSALGWAESIAEDTGTALLGDLVRSAPDLSRLAYLAMSMICSA
jgi:hypothetical protein